MFSINIFFRRLKLQPMVSLILLGGLVLSLTACILISAFVSGELRYDRFHKNLDRIALLTQFENSMISGGKLGTDIKLHYPQVEEVARLKQHNVLVSSGNTNSYEDNFYFADPATLSIFSFSWVEGNQQNSLSNANGIIITTSTANKYFGKSSALGKELVINEKFRFTVEGVINNLPAQSHLHIDIMASYKSANDIVGYDVTENYWGLGANTYFLLKDASLLKDLQTNLPGYVGSLNDPNAVSVWKLKLIPLRDLYLRSSLIGTSPISYVYIFSAAVFLILLLAGFNYINLSTASATVRFREVGMRKILGSSLISLRAMFLKEAICMIALAVIIAVAISFILMPWLSRVSGWELSFKPLLVPQFIAFAGLLVVGFIFLSGLYPAWLLSSGKPIMLIQGKSYVGNGKIQLRRFLVVFQFAVSAIMMVVTLCVYRQLEYIQSKNLGYNREQILTIDFRDADAQTKTRFKQKVLQLPYVEAASIAFALPGSNIFQGQKLVKELVPQGSDDASIIRITIDKDYAATFGIKLIQGRLLDEKLPADRTKYLVNKAALLHFGWKDFQGKSTGYYSYQYNPDGSYNEVPVMGEVVGVLDDYHHNDLKTSIKPMIFSLNDGYESKMGIRIASGDVTSTLASISKIWNEVLPNKPFEYAFMDDVFNKTYSSELRTGKVFTGFAIVAIIISCLGLFGLVYFALQRRQREISIRKVLGASITSIAGIISKEFLLLSLIASFIGLPFAWLGISKWLQDFAYHFSFEWWLLMAPVFVLLLLVGLTLVTLVMRAALAKPIKYLRNE